MSQTPIPRRAAGQIATALADTRVVLVAGPRQAGKSTLVQHFADEGRRYVSLDDAQVLAAAKADPIGFIRTLDRAVIDEIQRAPELMLAIKDSVDRDPSPGRFLITGSTNLMAMSSVGDSLAGRIERVMLYPLAQAEITRSAGTMIDRLFAGERPTWSGEAVFGEPLLRAVLAGGYPEAVKRTDEARRRRWFGDYLGLVLDRDVRDIAAVEQLEKLPRLMELLGEHASQLTNYAALGNALGLTKPTVSRYLSILERLFLVQATRPWFTNRISRLIKTPKVHFLDSGLLAYLRGDTRASFDLDRQRLGPLMETFAAGEILKQLTWSQVDVHFSHFRTREGDEVDIVLEDTRGRIVGIEIKAGATLAMKDFSGLKKLEQAAGDKFVRGLIMHDHDRITPVSEKIQGVPLSLLWQM
jgi:predicted AAA+ superfamily ATPase